eukprot:s1556_g8.t1
MSQNESKIVSNGMDSAWTNVFMAILTSAENRIADRIHASFKSVEHTNLWGNKEMVAVQQIHKSTQHFGHFCSQTIGQHATGLQLKAL